MLLITTLLFIASFLNIAFTQSTAINTTVEYNLKTWIKPGQAGKEQYTNLWVSTTHTGAGENDVVLVPLQSNSSAGWLNMTNVTSPTGQQFYKQAFDLGNPFPWQMIMAESVNFYAAWQPVRINAGLGNGYSGISGGFFTNETGLQWSSNAGEGSGDAFGGWLVCDWWHNAPQLFFRISSYDAVSPAPSSCADVWLMPYYI